MSLQLAYGYNVMSPTVARMVTARILQTAQLQAWHDITKVHQITRDEAAYHLLYDHLLERSIGLPAMPDPLVTEMRRMHPDAADSAHEVFYDYLHDC